MIKGPDYNAEASKESVTNDCFYPDDAAGVPCQSPNAYLLGASSLLLRFRVRLDAARMPRRFIDIAIQVESELKLPQRFMKLQVAVLVDTEFFPCVNEVILIKLMTEISDHIIDVDTITQTVEKRRTCVWYDDVKNYYEGILQVAKMQAFFKEHLPVSTPWSARRSGRIHEGMIGLQCVVGGQVFLFRGDYCSLTGWKGIWRIILMQTGTLSSAMPPCSNIIQTEIRAILISTKTSACRKYSTITEMLYSSPDIPTFRQMSYAENGIQTAISISTAAAWSSTDTGGEESPTGLERTAALQRCQYTRTALIL